MYGSKQAITCSPPAQAWIASDFNCQDLQSRSWGQTFNAPDGSGIYACIQIYVCVYICVYTDICMCVYMRVYRYMYVCTGRWIDKARHIHREREKVARGVGVLTRLMAWVYVRVYRYIYTCIDIWVDRYIDT